MVKLTRKESNTNTKKKKKNTNTKKRSILQLLNAPVRYIKRKVKNIYKKGIAKLSNNNNNKFKK